MSKSLSDVLLIGEMFEVFGGAVFIYAGLRSHWAEYPAQRQTVLSIRSCGYYSIDGGIDKIGDSNFTVQITKGY